MTSAIPSRLLGHRTEQNRPEPRNGPEPRGPEPSTLDFGSGGTQFLAVSGLLTERLLVTYRAPAAQLARLVPAPLELDTHEGFGFLSVCAVEIADMGVVGTPRWLRFQNREFLYRVGVRLHGEPSFIALRSDVSARTLAVLGRFFSHFRPHLADVSFERADGTLRVTGRTARGDGDATVEVSTGGCARPDTVFASQQAAAAFLLGMPGSCDVVGGRVRVQSIEHGPWEPRFVATRVARFSFIERLERELGTHFELDGTLAVRNVPHVWKAAKWL